MGSEWKEVIFSEVIEINPNRELSKGQEYPFIDMQAVEPYTRKVSNIKFRKYNGSGSKFKNGDTLFARITPCLENGKTAYVKELKSGEKGFGSTEFLVFSGKEGVTDNLFVYYLSRSPEIREYAVKNMIGTSGRQRVDKSCFNELRIKLPPLPEQQKIASILSAFDDKIELNNEMNKTLEEIAQAIFKHWFIDFEFPNENGEPYKSSGGEFVDSELGPIPKGWKVIKISEICEIQIGGDWGKDDKFEGAVPVYCLRGVDLQKLKENGYSNELPLRWVKKSSLEKRMLSSEDILIAGSGVGPVGRTLYFHESIASLYEYPLVYSNFCKRIKAKSEKYAIYIEQVLENMYTKGEMTLYINGTSVPNLNINGLIEHKVVLPTDDILNKYADFKSKVLARKYSKENLTLSQLRDTLLPKLISGEIRVM